MADALISDSDYWTRELIETDPLTFPSPPPPLPPYTEWARGSMVLVPMGLYVVLVLLPIIFWPLGNAMELNESVNTIHHDRATSRKATYIFFLNRLSLKRLICHHWLYQFSFKFIGQWNAWSFLSDPSPSPHAMWMGAESYWNSPLHIKMIEMFYYRTF